MSESGIGCRSNFCLQVTLRADFEPQIKTLRQVADTARPQENQFQGFQGNSFAFLKNGRCRASKHVDLNE